jgi:SAM-dependent methyltransferase
MTEPPRTPRLPPILETVARYYSEKVERFGATAAGVDWNSAGSQRLRFDQLLVLDEAPTGRSINDYGCGYGELLTYLGETGRDWTYAGFDIADAMIERARVLHGANPQASFTTSSASLEPADYAVASGIFNVRLGHEPDVWLAYVLETIADLDRLGRAGFAFNMLSTYSDPPRRRADLYYGDPRLFFDYCKQRFSSRVALLHDYPLYEFTIIVRK